MIARLTGSYLPTRSISRLVEKVKMTPIPAVQKAVLIRETGGLDVLRYEQDFPVPKIGNNEILIKNKYAGINYIESYFRKGIYPSKKPYVLGREASGVVVAKGDAVTKFDVNDKVAYLSSNTFAQYTKISEAGTVSKVPQDSTDEQLKLYAGSLVQALTSLAFVREAYPVKKGDYILLYAAAGGAGLAFNQFLKKAGAHTIAVASTDEKLQLAKEYGAEFLINSSKDDVLARVLEITNGQGVEAAFDSVGKDTFETSLKALKRKGTLVSFGNASGPVPPVAINILTPKNIKLLRPSLFGYIATHEEWESYSSELFDLLHSGALKILISKTYPLEEYNQAAEQLESRKTVGKLMLEISQD
ncbi:NADPH:quinone reductase [Lachancea thermotolerans CBS 6340]|uniref:Probable quinone oxidoreductase n=1 Tax=Lachancea thermotolerans (strain ATCC 56472 / CBS 6340 / NRRL Y-8284) TaxID=559295 RepID=C5DEB6_LACTC|nr:KLTH0C07854p [Lachancea thermotolerans CBS 6340]CAR22127.1 KLTH0C07854p [Lachancea thermotolerans CBS 6340]